MKENKSRDALVYMCGYLLGVSPEKSPVPSMNLVRFPNQMDGGDSWNDVCGGGCGFAMAILVVQTVWKVERDGIEAGTNLVPDSVPRSIAKVFVTVVALALSLVVLKSLLSTIFFVLMTPQLWIQSQMETTRSQPPPTTIMAKVTAKHQRKAFSEGEAIRGLTAVKASSVVFRRRSNR